MQSMNVTRSRVALVADMDRLWAIGGYDGMKNLSTVSRKYHKYKYKYKYYKYYDGMKNLSTVSVANTCNSTLLTLLAFQVEMYNPEEDSWSFVASMESHEGGVGVGVIPMV